MIGDEECAKCAGACLKRCPRVLNGIGAVPSKCVTLIRFQDSLGSVKIRSCWPSPLRALAADLASNRFYLIAYIAWCH